MCSNRYRKVKDTIDEFDKSWEEEIERLKHDIKKAEKKIFFTEQNRFAEKQNFIKGFNKSDSDSVEVAIVERMISTGKFTSLVNPGDAVQKDLADARSLERLAKESGYWVSPTVSKPQTTRRDPFPDPLNSSFDIDCGSSVISLDFGLVSPSKNLSSPPQRIERAQNREWSSPHRVIDRPSPENSPGNWISMKESTAKHSPALVLKNDAPEAPKFACPQPEPTLSTECTFVLPGARKCEAQNPQDSQPKRKISVLGDYEPERVVLTTKKRAGGSADAVEINLLPTNDKVRRVVDPTGHVIKISLLDDLEAPAFGKTHDKMTEAVEKEAGELPEKTARGTTSKLTKISTKLSPLVSKPPAKKRKEEGGTRIQSVSDGEKRSDQMEEQEKSRGESGEKEDVTKSTQKIVQDLEEILRASKNGETSTSPVKEKPNEKPKPMKKFKPCPKAVEEKLTEAPEKRKRNVDPKAVQEYIKSQKQKRMEQVKTEKKTKDAEKEARKKKLEELRIKTLKLAAQSRKKKPPEPAIPTPSAVDPGTEDDVTMSLGLKQTKPKVSYNESVLKLKKKTVAPKPQLVQKLQSADESDNKEEEDEKTLENVETIQVIEVEELKKPEETVKLKTSQNLNDTLKKLAETLHLKLDQQEKLSRPTTVASKSVKDPQSQVPSQESLFSVKSAPEQNRQLVTVDLETIQTLKSDIKKISENFKVLHEIIVDKADLSGKTVENKLQQKPQSQVPDWLKSFLPRAYPHNVLSAFQKKMNIKTTKTPSTTSQGSSTFAEPISNKYDSEFEALSMPSDRLLSAQETLGSRKFSSCGTSEENYFSLKEDSGSELSSSILDSEKQSFSSGRSKPQTLSRGTRSKDSVTSSIATEISSRSIRLVTSKGFDSSNSYRKLSSDRENMTLVTPDLKLISNDLHQEKLNNCTKNLNVLHDLQPEELNNSEKSYKDQKTDSTIAELIDNLTENEKSVKSTNEKPQNVVRRVEEVHVRRSFFQPEMLHLQFQAELTLLETFQQSLSHFLEAERIKTLTEVNKIVYEKAINTEKPVNREDQAVQTSQLQESETGSDETDSVKTEINVEEETESEKRDLVSEISEKLSTSSKETLKETHQKDLETSDFSNSHAGISFQMLNRMMKDEELRSEHQLALIRLREKTLNEKVKAELTFLEMKKRALKERGGDEEQNISAIKKKQRGILLKYQSEKEEIERLKKMHKIASEERKIMIKQQKQIQQMQISTKDMIIKLKKRERSPTKKSPIKPRTLKSSESQSEVPEDIPIVSDSILTESAYSGEESSRTDFDGSSRSYISDDESDNLEKSSKPLRSKFSCSLENLKSKKSQLEIEKYPRKRHSVEELLSWTRRLEEKENHLKELEKQAIMAAKTKFTKSLKSVKTSMKDRSTSPFQFQDSTKTISEVSPSEVTEAKRSSTISEVVLSNAQSETTEKTESVFEKIQSSASEDIPEQFSKKLSISRTTEYYSESFESPSSSETAKTKPEIIRTKPVSDWGHKGVAIKLSLSPRMQSPKRRYSSGSDDSVNLSHTETASEQSDLESRIAALHEQLRKRKLEAERLRREQKKAQRERLKVKEQSLLKQIQAYDAYIQKKKQELEQEYDKQKNSIRIVMKPLIKQPKVAEKSALKRQELIMQDTDKLGLHSRLGTKPKDKEESPHFEKTPEKESDSEVSEQIKPASESVLEPAEESESIKEQIGSRLEEEENNTKATESIPEVENVTKESMKSSSASESLLEQDILEGSSSESEDQSISIKTTLHSPEKEDTEVMESPTGKGEEDSQTKQTIDEDAYQFDSFESDAEEKPTSGSENVQDISEIRSESGVSEAIIEEVTDEEEEEEKEEKGERKSEKAERVADSIITGLILESLNMFRSKKAEVERKLAEKSKLSLEALSGYLAREIISEAVDDMIEIYNRKDEKGSSPDRIGTEVQRRITEIMSQGGDEKDQKLPQDPTIRLSLVKTPPEETEQKSHLQSLTSAKREKKAQVQIPLEGGEGGIRDESKPETVTQEWIDDDFGLSQTRREAEELRLQQLQIEQEIQQLQAQQEQVPYFYLREIPNKPPPPYTPPGKPLAEIPTSEPEVMAIAMNAVRILVEETKKGKEITKVEPGWDYYGDAVSEHLKCYKFFLFDLARHIIGELLKQQEEKTEILPWLRTRENLSKYKYKKIERSLECLSEFVGKQVSVLFGFGRKVSKESLIVRWIKKKRDHVDEILVGESQEEEAQWTRYDEDQVAVKNEVAMAILDSLLEDTAKIIDGIVSNKLKKEKSKRG